MKATLRLRAELAALPALGLWVDAQVVGLDAHHAYALRLCVEELVGNVLLHGAAGALQVIVDGPPLRLVVEDDGPAFDPTVVSGPSLPTSLDEARPGGLGLLLTRRYSRGMAYARAGGWNRLELTF